MSVPEQKVPEKSKSDLRYEELQKEIKALTEKMEQYKPQMKISHSIPDHFDPKDLETTCPDCKKKIDEFKLKVGEEYALAHGLETAQKLYKERAVHSHKCKECGLGVKDEELKDPDRGCVLCGNKQAR